MGFANLPNQVHRKSVKKGFEFTLMVVGRCDFVILLVVIKYIYILSTFALVCFTGESGLGKSTLVDSLFLTDLYDETEIPTALSMYPLHTVSYPACHPPTIPVLNVLFCLRARSFGPIPK